MNNYHINCTAIDEKNSFLYGGDTEGFLYKFDLENLQLIKREKVSDGTLQALYIKNGIIAGLSNDHFMVVGELSNLGFKQIEKVSMRKLNTDEYLSMHSASQAVSIHPIKKEIISKASNGALVYFDVEEFGVKFKGFVRVFKNSDIITARYVDNGQKILVGSADGEVALIEDKKITHIWSFPEIDESVHWFHECKDRTIAVATDSMRLIKLDLVTREGKVGPLIAKDDFEHVSQLMNGDLIASSFDRCIYRIDQSSLASIEVIHKTPFKIRWLHTLKDSDDIIMQIRNGSIRRISSCTGEIKAEWKKVHDCIWSGTVDQNKVFFAGEGNKIWIWDQESVYGSYQEIKCDSNRYYTKRLIAKNGYLFIGRSSGTVHVIKDKKTIHLLERQSAPVRDLCLHPFRPLLYVAREDGSVITYNYESGNIVHTSLYDLPIWSITISPNGKMLAIAKRMGKFFILDTESYEEITSGPCRLTKRAKWITDDDLLVVHSHSINRISFKEGEWQLLEEFFSGEENTIEDFVVDEEKKYLVAVSYNKKVMLFDYETGEKLDFLYNGTDLMKGIIHYKKDNQSFFTTFGRCGFLKIYLIHNNQLFPAKTLNIKRIES